MKKHKIPENLKRLRNQARLTKTGLRRELTAKGFVIPFCTYRNWEDGRCEPHIDAIKAIADFYGITMDELCYGDKPITNTKINDRQEKRYCGASAAGSCQSLKHS